MLINVRVSINKKQTLHGFKIIEEFLGNISQKFILLNSNTAFYTAPDSRQPLF